MNQLTASSTAFGIVISIFAYLIGVMLNRKFRSPLINPLLISVIIVIAFLALFKIDYENYNESAKYLSYLLTPATVSLSIPLYRELALLKKNFKAIMAGIVSGTLASLGSILLFSFLFGFSHEEYVTMLPKSITTAIGMVVSDELGGMVTVTVAAIIVSGLTGNIFGETIFKLFSINSAIAKGSALGTAAHAVGTARAMEMGEVEGAMSSLSIVVAGIITSVLAPVFAGFM